MVMDGLDKEFKENIAQLMDSAVETMTSIFQIDKEVGNIYSKKLPKEQVDEIIKWIDDEALPLYEELGMVDRVIKVKRIKDTILKNNENIR